MRRLLLVALGILLVGQALVAPVSAGGGHSVTFVLSGQVTGVERQWTTVEEDGSVVMHFRGTTILGTVSGDLVGAASVYSASDIDVITGQGRHRGFLAITTPEGGFEGRFRGSTTESVHLEGLWVAHGTGAYAGMRLRAQYVGDFYLFGSLVFTGTVT